MTTTHMWSTAMRRTDIIMTDSDSNITPSHPP